MGWTRERPTEPGWYWLLHHTGDFECVLVEDGDGDGELFVVADANDYERMTQDLEPWPRRDCHVTAMRENRRPHQRPWTREWWHREDHFAACAWAPAEPPPYDGDL